MSKEYTHQSPDGLRWRMEGSRPVSEIADRVMQECEREQKERKKKMANRSATEIAHDVRHLLGKRNAVKVTIQYFRKMSKRENIRDTFIHYDVNEELKKDGIIAQRWGEEVFFMKWRRVTDKYFLTAAQAKKKIRAGYRAEGAIVPRIYQRLTLVKRAAC